MPAKRIIIPKSKRPRKPQYEYTSLRKYTMEEWEKLPQMISKDEFKRIYQEIERLNKLLSSREKTHSTGQRDDQKAISKLIEDIRQVIAILPKEAPKARLELALDRFIGTRRPGRNLRRV